ncbi:hypothetical protein MMC28_003395 [Mycoblastus sanguinarius]|nr:hypothetical protein [Mycoblastus sanguinarius]
MSSPGSSTSGVAQRPQVWQDRLQEHCRRAQLPAPRYEIVSDRRGKRTAWSCTITVSGQNIMARYWYDGQYVNQAKEDAAEKALQTLQGRANGGGAAGRGAELGAGQQQGRIVGWGR